MTYKYRLFPTSAQRTSLEQTLELCRWVYNDTLAIRKDAWEKERRRVDYLYDTNKDVATLESRQARTDVGSFSGLAECDRAS